MAKLGKKARKFARKNLQSVLKRRRKFKSMRDSFKRKNSSRTGEISEDVDSTGRNSGGIHEGALKDGTLVNTSLQMLFGESDNEFMDNDSDSDGFFSEDNESSYLVESNSVNASEENSTWGGSPEQNGEIFSELMKQKRKLESLRKKDTGFSDFLEGHVSNLIRLRNAHNHSDEDDENSDEDDSTEVQGSRPWEGRFLTRSMVESWSKLVIEKKSLSLLPQLLNGFRAACHYGSDNLDPASQCKIQDKEAFCKILMFVLQEADGLFRKLFGIPCSGCKKETVLELTNSLKWKTSRKFVKSYLRSTLHLLTEVTDKEILEFTLSRIRVSVIFLAAFPLLMRRFFKVAVHLWATGGESLSVSAFLAICEMAVQLDSDFLENCLIKTYKAFIANCKFVDPGKLKHIRLMRDSVVELYSIDIQKSYGKVLTSVRQLAGILQLALRTKKKEALKKIYSWQYINCVQLWVDFICMNIQDYDLHGLLYSVIQIIIGVAHLFTGLRYIPLRLKCIQLLNQLSNAAGIFIPIAFLVLSCLEYKGTFKTSPRPELTADISSILKVPKPLLKSQDFHCECSISAIELLSAHFARWSYHIAFPAVATIPLIRLKQVQQKTAIEKLQRILQSFIHQVEQNVQFVQKKREDVTFSPKDQAAVDSFLQLEKTAAPAAFTQYYASLLQKSLSRNIALNEKLSSLEGKKRQKDTNIKSEDGSLRRKKRKSDNGSTQKKKKAK